MVYVNMAKGYTQETFEKRVKEVHGDSIDVSNFKYINSITTGEARCNICGNVWKPRADVLIRGCGCRKCFDKRHSDAKTIPFKEIQEKISGVTLNEETYIDTKHHCEAKCNKCGNIWYPHVRDLINGSRCPKCAKKSAREKMEVVYARRRKPKEERLSKDELKEINRQKYLDSFIRRANDKFSNKFKYNKGSFVNMRTKMEITCPIHGTFFQSPKQHLSTEFGCRECGIEGNTKRRTMPWKKVKELFENAKLKWGYDASTYISASKEMRFICKEHGEFWRIPIGILHNGSCPECSKTRALTQREFEDKANKIHNFKYDYSKTQYVNANTIVDIICPIHGIFQQTPNVHLDGCGCPRCNDSHLERDVRDVLSINGIEFIQGKHYTWLLNEESNNPLTLDFYLPKYKIAIECQGIQHFKAVEHFGGNDKFEYRKSLDKKKKELCKNNNIKLIYYLENKYNKYMKEDDVYFNNVNVLVRYINEHGET